MEAGAAGTRPKNGRHAAVSGAIHSGSAWRAEIEIVDRKDQMIVGSIVTPIEKRFF